MLKKHKRHFKLLLCVLAGTFGALALSFSWSFQLVEFPSPLIHYIRIFNANLASKPRLTSQLDIKFQRQEHSLSCEAATLKMVLNFHGIDVSESEIIAKINFDNTQRSGNIWGNPHLGFVGNIDGEMMKDGYGVYWEPLALTASNWKKVGILKNGLSEDLVKHISEGRPVIVWGYLGRGLPVSWKTPDGEIIRGVNGEHTRIVYGYRGSAENPEGFMVMDPTYGPQYWEKSKFLRNWDSFGRMGLVVYP